MNEFKHLKKFTLPNVNPFTKFYTKFLFDVAEKKM